MRKLGGLAYKGKRLKVELSIACVLEETSFNTKSFAFTILLRKPTKIFIGNVPVNCTSEDLRSVFETTGLDIHECDKVIL